MKHSSTNVSMWSIAWLMSCRASYGISAAGKTQLRNRRASYLWLVAMSKVFYVVYHWNMGVNINNDQDGVTYIHSTCMQGLITAVLSVLSLSSWSVCFSNLWQMFEVKVCHRLYLILAVWKGQTKGLVARSAENPPDKNHNICIRFNG